MQKNQGSKSRDKMIKEIFGNYDRKIDQPTSQSTNLQTDMTDWTADHSTKDQRMDIKGREVTLELNRAGEFW